MCLLRRPGLVKGAWSVEEDENLVTLIGQGFANWSELATHTPGRTAKQVILWSLLCRYRWNPFGCQPLNLDVSHEIYNSTIMGFVLKLVWKPKGVLTFFSASYFSNNASGNIVRWWYNRPIIAPRPNRCHHPPMLPAWLTCRFLLLGRSQSGCSAESAGVTTWTLA